MFYDSMQKILLFHVFLNYITWFGLTEKNIKLPNRIENLPNFGMKKSKLGIAYTKSLEVKTQFNHKFHSKSERLLLNSTDLLRIILDF